MTKEEVVLKNKKGRRVYFIKEQTEDDIVLVRKVNQNSSLAGKKIIIHTMDLNKVKDFQKIKVELPNRKSVLGRIVESVSRARRRNPVANKR